MNCCVWSCLVSTSALRGGLRRHGPGAAGWRTRRGAVALEVPLITRLAQAKARGGLAVLDGPQGVDVVPERIVVSLLRGPTWPIPGRIVVGTVSDWR